jgi:Pyridoxamine 5'-phosphate oxidase
MELRRDPAARSVRLDARVRSFLGESMIARLATLSESTGPRLTPLWFVLDRDRFYMNTRADSPAARDIRADGRVVVLFRRDRSADSPQTLRKGGTARFLTDPTVNRRMYLRSALKYHLSPGGIRNLLAGLRSLPTRLLYYRERAGEAGTIEVRPESAEWLEMRA